MDLSDKLIKLLIGIVALAVTVYLVLFSIGTYLNWKDYKKQQIVVPVQGKIVFNSTYRDELSSSFVLEDGKITAIGSGRKRLFADYRKSLSRSMEAFYIDDLDGNIIKQIPIPPAYSPFDFDISPDGKTIVFTSKMGETGVPYNVYTINIDGKNLIRLTNFTLLGRWTVSEPSYSPDGSKIVFTAGKDPLQGDSPTSLYLMNADGTGMHELFGSSYEAGWEGTWSPDGKSIAFVCTTDGYRNLFIINLDTKNVKQVTHFDSKNYGQAYTPCYSPDGNQICFALKLRGTTAGQEIFAINTDGTNLIRLTPAKRVSQYPGWATDKYPDWGK